MESAKTQTWCPNELFSPPVGGDDFIVTNIEALPCVRVEETTKPAEQAVTPEETPFQLDPRLFELLKGDEGVQAELNRVIEERVKQGIETLYQEAVPRLHAEVEAKKAEAEARFAEVEKIREEAKRSGYEEGHKEGKELGLSELKAAEVLRIQELENQFQSLFFERVNKICSELLKQKESLLHEHEKAWSLALRTLLKRFQVGQSVALGDALEKWMTDYVTEFAEKKKIKVLLSSAEYEKFQPILEKLPNSPKWDLVRDPRLQEGESRYECDGGGIFFSTSEEFKKLDAWLTEIEASHGS